MKIIEHEELKLKFELPELTQGMLEKYQISLEQRSEDTDLKNLNILAGVVYNGAVTRAAVDAELLPSDLDVTAMKPVAVIWLSARISEHIIEAMSISGE